MIVIIILHHAGLIPFLRHGYLGVDMFFAIAGFFLMQSYEAHQITAEQYTAKRIKKVFVPYLICFLLAAILDYKRLMSFKDFDEFFGNFAPFHAFLTFTEELGPQFHTAVILVGGWFLSVLFIGGFLLYSLLRQNEKLTLNVILPFAIVLGFTYLFNQQPSIENFSAKGAISFPLLRGFIEMSLGAIIYSFIKNNESFLSRYSFVIIPFACVSFAIFIASMLTQKTFDAFLVITIPFILVGLYTLDNKLQEKAISLKVLPVIGAISLEMFLIHSPIIHIVHSGLTKLLKLSINPYILAIIDVVAVILAAILLKNITKKICSKPIPAE